MQKKFYGIQANFNASLGLYNKKKKEENESSENNQISKGRYVLMSPLEPSNHFAIFFIVYASVVC